MALHGFDITRTTQEFKANNFFWVLNPPWKGEGVANRLVIGEGKHLLKQSVLIKTTDLNKNYIKKT